MTIKDMLDSFNRVFKANQRQSRCEREEDETMWHEALCSFTETEIERGIKHLIKTSKYYPKPAELIEAIENTETSRPDALDFIALRIQRLKERYEAGLKTPEIQARWKYMCEQAYRIACRPNSPEKAESRRKWKASAQALDTTTSLRAEAHDAGRTVPPLPAWLIKWYEELSEEERIRYTGGNPLEVIKK